ncbi:MAG: FlgO family outer membrane protein, partial [Gammaproteobacteria bacterium]|nr:FlgO family outer membrane protein [Gammaproteobacteria bacterium]
MAQSTKLHQFTVGDWTATPSLDRLERNGQTVSIEPTAMAVLVYLAQHPGLVVSTEEIITAVWRGRAVGDDAVYQRIYGLRAVFKDDPHNARYIETIPTKGYRLIAAVKFAGDGITDARFNKRWATVASVLLATFLGISYLVSQQSNDAVLPLATPFQVAEANSIAVLPFVDMSDQQDQQYLGDGISEELIHTLSNIPGLRVAARTSTFLIAQTDSDIRTIGEKLNVAQVLEGSVRRQGDQVRITAQLVNVADGYHLWSKTYDRNATDLIRIQQEIAVAVAESFAATLKIDTADKDNQASVTDVDAYGYYLLGRHHLRTGQSEDLKQAVAYFRRATEVDPDFSRAYSGLASATLLRSWGNDRKVDEILRTAETAIEQALAIDPQNAEAYAALGIFRARKDENTGAIAAFEQAIELNSNFVMAYSWYAIVLGFEGRKQDSLSAHEMSARLDPLSADLQIELGAFHLDEGHVETAMVYWDKAIELEPTRFIAYMDSLFYRYYTGQLDQSVLLLIQYIENAGDDATWSAYLPLMWAYRAMYDLDAADFWLDRFMDSDVAERLIPHERALALMARHNYEEVGAILHDWVNEAADKPWDLHQIAWYEMIIGHDDHARQAYDRIEELPADIRAAASADEFNIQFGGHFPAVNRAHLMLRAGNSESAEDMLAKSREHITKRLSQNLLYPAGDLHVLAAIDAIQGNQERALNWLRQAIDAGWTRVWFTEQDPNFASLLDDPEFQEIMTETKGRLDGMRKQVHLAIGADPSKLFS